MAYALSDMGARLLADHGFQFVNAGWSRKNGAAGRPFIEHQLEIVDFYVALQRAAKEHEGIRLIHPEELIAAFPGESRMKPNPIALPVCISRAGKAFEMSLVPDLIFGLGYADGSRRCFMVEIDRGTMPISRSTLSQSSFERKMLAYLMIHADRQHERHFGWNTFRVLTVTTDASRLRSIREALAKMASSNVGNGMIRRLFWFATRSAILESNPVALCWRDGDDREVRLD